jgi:hypothetical protein
MAKEELVYKNDSLNEFLLPLFTALIFLLSVGRLVTIVHYQLGVPFDLIYESPNLSTIKLIQSGKNIYSPNVYAIPPFYITIYTPLYHYLVALGPTNTLNPFLFGRLIGMIFMFGSAFVLFLIRPGKEILFSIIAFAVFF